MKIIKLDAIESTNSYLKDLAKQTELENFTVVSALKQTNGRGQMHTKWISESGKNLTFSVFCRFENLRFKDQRNLNFAITVAVLETLTFLKLPDLSIKWPNDILSEKQKICGVLIENTLKGNHIISSIIGIGLNVNQVEFPEELNNVTSVCVKLGKQFDLDELLNILLNNLKKYIEELVLNNFSFLEESYLKHLYKINVPTMFVTSKGQIFMGKIIGVSRSGRLMIELDDENIVEFGIKEVAFLKQ